MVGRQAAVRISTVYAKWHILPGNQMSPFHLCNSHYSEMGKLMSKHPGCVIGKYLKMTTSLIGSKGLPLGFQVNITLPMVVPLFSQTQESQEAITVFIHQDDKGSALLVTENGGQLLSPLPQSGVLNWETISIFKYLPPGLLCYYRMSSENLRCRRGIVPFLFKKQTKYLMVHNIHLEQERQNT